MAQRYKGKPMRVLSLMLMLVGVLPAAVAAQQGSATETPAEYDIEMVLFLRDANPAGEYWPEDAEAPDPALAVTTVRGGRPPRPLGMESAEVVPSRPELVTPLPEAAYQLKPHAEALRRQGLAPLMHVAWRQAVGDRDNRDWLWLDAPPMQGMVRISLGRYLHIDADLALRLDEGNPQQPKVIRTRERRRMRSGELHYLDHPGFGLLVVITPHENDVPEVAPVTPL
jgi:hypothetical protein